MLIKRISDLIYRVWIQRYLGMDYSIYVKRPFVVVGKEYIMPFLIMERILVR